MTHDIRLNRKDAKAQRMGKLGEINTFEIEKRRVQKPALRLCGLNASNGEKEELVKTNFFGYPLKFRLVMQVIELRLCHQPWHLHVMTLIGSI